MFEPIEFPEFHSDIRLHQQLSELQSKYSKLQTAKKVLWAGVIVLGTCLIISLITQRNARLKYKPVTFSKNDDDTIT